MAKKKFPVPSADPCARQPDTKRKLLGGITAHIYRDVPVTEVAILINCRRGDPDYWDEDWAQGSDEHHCDVLIYYKKREEQPGGG